MSNVNVYKQRPDAVRGESPLFHAGLDELVRKAPLHKGSNAGITLREKKLLGHLVLRGDAKDPAFAGGVQHATGLELPVALTLVANADSSLQWLAPDEWLLIVPGGTEYEVEQKLRAALDGQHISLVNVSGGQTILELSGPKVRELLMKSSSYDVHPSNFPVGKAVGTVFAKSQLVIRHTGEDCWELLVRRSFADYIWLWLQDASAEYGLVIKA
ncbi:MAG TPA: sarcosine oxidase subunit gamma family protein [Pseudomonas sp.]|nr:sarcosine oxidase subunit gamma family protein [Pseudomonas sp.]